MSATDKDARAAAWNASDAGKAAKAACDARAAYLAKTAAPVSP